MLRRAGQVQEEAGASRTAIRLLAVLAMGTMLAACGRCGDFWPSSQSQIDACYKDRSPPQ
jgi:hypothetical protein